MSHHSSLSIRNTCVTLSHMIKEKPGQEYPRACPHTSSYTGNQCQYNVYAPLYYGEHAHMNSFPLVWQTATLFIVHVYTRFRSHSDKKIE